MSLLSFLFFLIQEKNDLLRKWIETKGNAKACESAIVLKRENMTQLKTGKKLMTVKDMIEAGFSATFGLLLRSICFVLFVRLYFLTITADLKTSARQLEEED